MGVKDFDEARLFAVVHVDNAAKVVLVLAP